MCTNQWKTRKHKSQFYVDVSSIAVDSGWHVGILGSVNIDPSGSLVCYVGLGAVWVGLWGALGRLWATFGDSWGDFGHLLRPLARPWALLGYSGDAPATILGGRGVLRKPSELSGHVFGRFRVSGTWIFHDFL